MRVCVMKTHTTHRRSRHIKKGSSPFDQKNNSKNPKLYIPIESKKYAEGVKKLSPSLKERQKRHRKRPHAERASREKPLVEKRLGEDNSFFEEEEEEEMGRLRNARGGALAGDVREGRVGALFQGVGGGVGETKETTLTRRRRRTTLARRRREEDEDEDEDEDGEEEDAKMRRLFARGGSDGREYELKSAVEEEEEETPEKNEKEREVKNRTSTHGGEKFRSFGSTEETRRRRRRRRRTASFRKLRINSRSTSLCTTRISATMGFYSLTLT